MALPRHIAIIMDGNGRWAKKRLLPRTVGHAQGSARVKDIIREADKLGVEALSLYAFSTENWKRPALEVQALMTLLREYLIKERQELIDNNVRFRIFGELAPIPEAVRQIVTETIELTKHNTGLNLNFCFNYGGRAELVRAMKLMAEQVKAGTLEPAAIDEAMVSAHLYSAGLPDPDLVIRTSGESRLSNFLIWQASYAEIYITDTLWPDFRPEHLREACENFAQRQRRFGDTGETQATIAPGA